MRRLRVTLGATYGQMAGCGITVLIALVVLIGATAILTGSFHFGETGRVIGFRTIGKDGCLLQEESCIWQYAVEIQQIKEIKQLIFDREDQIPPVEVGKTIQFTGASGSDPKKILVWSASVFTPNTDKIPDVWTPPTPEPDPYTP